MLFLLVFKFIVGLYIACFNAVVLKLGSTEPQGFGEAVAGVRLRSE